MAIIRFVKVTISHVHGATTQSLRLLVQYSDESKLTRLFGCHVNVKDHRILVCHSAKAQHTFCTCQHESSHQHAAFPHPPLGLYMQQWRSQVRGAC